MDTKDYSPEREKVRRTRRNGHSSKDGHHDHGKRSSTPSHLESERKHRHHARDSRRPHSTTPSESDQRKSSRERRPHSTTPSTVASSKGGMSAVEVESKVPSVGSEKRHYVRRHREQARPHSTTPFSEGEEQRHRHSREDKPRSKTPSEGSLKHRHGHHHHHHTRSLTPSQSGFDPDEDIPEESSIEVHSFQDQFSSASPELHYTSATTTSSRTVKATKKTMLKYMIHEVRELKRQVDPNAPDIHIWQRRHRRRTGESTDQDQDPEEIQEESSPTSEQPIAGQQSSSSSQQSSASRRRRLLPSIPQREGDIETRMLRETGVTSHSRPPLGTHQTGDTSVPGPTIHINRFKLQDQLKK